MHLARVHETLKPSAAEVRARGVGTEKMVSITRRTGVFHRQGAMGVRSNQEHQLFHKRGKGYQDQNMYFHYLLFNRGRKDKILFKAAQLARPPAQAPWRTDTLDSVY